MRLPQGLLGHRSLCRLSCRPLHLCHDRLHHDQVETGIVLVLDVPVVFVVLVLVVLYPLVMIVLIMIKLKQVSSVFGFPSSLP